MSHNERTKPLNISGHNHKHYNEPSLRLSDEQIAKAVLGFPLPPLFSGIIPEEQLLKILPKKLSSYAHDGKELKAFDKALKSLEQNPTRTNMMKIFSLFKHRQFKTYRKDVFLDLHLQKDTKKPLLLMQRLFESPFGPSRSCDVLYKSFKKDATIEVTCMMSREQEDQASEILVLDPNAPTPTFFNLYFNITDLVTEIVKGPDYECRFRRPCLLGGKHQHPELDPSLHARFHADEQSLSDKQKAHIGGPKAETPPTPS